MEQLPREVTRILEEWTSGNDEALARLMPLVFDELRTIARRYLDREARNHTLQPTALVHEVYLRLKGRHTVSWRNRAQFFGFSAQLMRRVLVDHARSQLAGKRGGGSARVSLDERIDLVDDRHDVDLVALDDALKALAVLNMRQSQIVEMRFFAGLTYEEIGEVLDVSRSTVKREWNVARLWLYRELAPD